jgi:hypothetical protein
MHNAEASGRSSRPPGTRSSSWTCHETRRSDHSSSTADRFAAATRTSAGLSRDAPLDGLAPASELTLRAMARSVTAAAHVIGSSSSAPRASTGLPTAPRGHRKRYSQGRRPQEQGAGQQNDDDPDARDSNPRRRRGAGSGPYAGPKLRRPPRTGTHWADSTAESVQVSGPCRTPWTAVRSLLSGRPQVRVLPGAHRAGCWNGL